MRNFKYTKEFVECCSQITKDVLAAVEWETWNLPLSRKEAAKYDFMFVDSLKLVDLWDHLIPELMSNTHGQADRQTCYSEWMGILEQIQLPPQEFFDKYKDERPDILWTAWDLVVNMRELCAELADNIQEVKKKYRLYDEKYLGDVLLPSQPLKMAWGQGYERTPRSYDEELVELAVMRGEERADAEELYLGKTSIADPNLEEKKQEAAKNLKEHLKRDYWSRSREVLEEIISCDTKEWCRATIDKYAINYHVKDIVRIVFPFVQQKYKVKTMEQLYDQLKGRARQTS